MTNNKVNNRFWSKVNKTETCWFWTKSLNETGYGRFSYKGKAQKAHRVSWILTYGEIPNNLHVLHKCDIPLCVNPKHLFLGTHQDNMNDQVRKNRQHKGSDIIQSKLTEKEVLEIRKIFKEKNISKIELAKMFNIGIKNLYCIINRKTWRHV